jgi:hypothetical protein
MRTRRGTRALWLSLGPVLVLAGTAAWWSPREPEGKPSTHQALERAEASARADGRAGEVLALVGEKGVGRAAKLAELYVRLARDPSAVGVRALALNALFGEESLPLRLKGVLDALNADPTPVRDDPLWSKATRKLAEQWSPEVFDKGRDLMLAEQRPRAKQALVDSFVDLATSDRAGDLTPEQSSALLTDLIDMHGTAEPERRGRIQAAVRELGGNDPADLLAGKPPQALEIQREYEKNLRAGVASLVNDPKAGD